MRYSTANSGRSDVWQRVLFVLLGVACVALCYFVGAYWLGPWLQRMSEGKSSQVPSVASSAPVTTGTPAAPPVSEPFSPVSPKLEGVRIRERDVNTLSETVRVIPSSDRTVPDEATPTEEPQPSTTLEDQPSAPAPPANLWTPPPTPSPSTSSRPGETEAPSNGVQTPQPLEGEPVPSSSISGAPAPADTLYRVRVPGAYENREEADAALRAVMDKGLPGAVVTDTAGGRKVFRVQLGVYRNKSSAEKLAEQARRLGVRAEVSAPSP
ncbi:MAG: hypothetical protein KatS3mg023_1978 [Armatimonadota bacterium]|nr:MAG: hypothetical protein KatS3mg023_1978 [Armatimonadota bacterium]